MDIKEINSEELEVLYKQTEKKLKSTERKLKKEKDIWKKILIKSTIVSIKKQISELLWLLEWNSKPKKDEEIIIHKIWVKEQVNILLDPLIFELLNLLSNKKSIKVNNLNEVKPYLAEQLWIHDSKLNLFLTKLWITDENLYEWIIVKKSKRRKKVIEEYINNSEVEIQLTEKEIQRNKLLELFEDENNLNNFKWDDNQIRLAEYINIDDLYSLYNMLNFITIKPGKTLQRELWYTPVRLKILEAKNLVEILTKYIEKSNNFIITLNEITTELDVDENIALLIIKLYGIDKINLENKEDLFKKPVIKSNYRKKEKKKKRTYTRRKEKASKEQNIIDQEKPLQEEKTKKVNKQIVAKTNTPKKVLESKEKKESIFLINPETWADKDNLNEENIEKYKWDENQFKLVKELNTSLGSLYVALYGIWIFKYLSYTSTPLNKNQTQELIKAIEILKDKPKILEEYKTSNNEEKFRTDLEITDKKITTRHILLLSGNEEVIKEMKSKNKLNHNKKTRNKTVQNIKDIEKTTEEIKLEEILKELLLIDTKGKPTRNNLNKENIEQTIEFLLSLPIKTKLKKYFRDLQPKNKPKKHIEKKEWIETQLRNKFLINPEIWVSEDNLNWENIEKYKWDKNQLKLVKELNTNLSNFYLTLNKILWKSKHFLEYSCIMLNKKQTQEVIKAIEILEEYPEILERYKETWNKKEFLDSLYIYDYKIKVVFILKLSGNENIIEEMKKKKKEKKVRITIKRNIF